MKNKNKQVGRPRKSVEELMQKRDDIECELYALRQKTPPKKRTAKQKQAIINVASYLCKLNRRIQTGEWI